MEGEVGAGAKADLVANVEADVRTGDGEGVPTDVGRAKIDSNENAEREPTAQKALVGRAKDSVAWLSGHAHAFARLLKSSPSARARFQACVAVCIVACGRTSPSPTAPDTSTGGIGIRLAAADAGEAGAPDPALSELWLRASEGAEEDLMRLARTLGPEGLIDGATSKEARGLAIHAMPFTDGFAGLPWLADLTGSEDVTLGREAAEAAVALASRGRDQNDPEDAEEMRAGCIKLIAVAKESKHDKLVRIRAVRTLRLLADRGCAKTDEIPTELDLSP